MLVGPGVEVLGMCSCVPLPLLPCSDGWAGFGIVGVALDGFRLVGLLVGFGGAGKYFFL